MAAFNNTLQKMVPMNGLRMEQGGNVTISGVSGQTFNVATKLKKVLGGFGYMETDGMMAIVTVENLASANGQLTFTRKAPIVTSADTISYMVFGY